MASLLQRDGPDNRVHGVGENEINSRRGEIVGLIVNVSKGSDQEGRRI